jgi:hypothetical protein
MNYNFVIQPNSRRFFRPSLFILGFLLSIVFFHWINIIEDYFYTATPLYSVYHILRIILAVYILCIFLGFGILFSRLLRFTPFINSLCPPEKILVFATLGLGTANVTAYMLGHINLLSIEVIFLLSVGVLFFSNQDLFQLGEECTSALRSLIPEERGYSRVFVIANLLVIVLIILVITLQVLPPTIDWDVLHHYQKHLATVIENGGFANSEYWYHHFLSDGQGGQFWAAILTDKYTPPIIALCLLTIVSAVIFSHARFLTEDFGLAILLVVFAFSTFAPFSGLDRQAFDKWHLVNGFFVFSVFFLALKSIQASNPEKSKALPTLAATSFFTTFCAPTMSAVVLPIVFIHLLFILFLKKDRRFLVLLPSILATVGLVGRLGLNHALYGIPEITPQGLWWKVVNLDQLQTLVSPYLIVTLISGSLGSLYLSPLDNFREFFFTSGSWRAMSTLAHVNHTLSITVASALAFYVLLRRAVTLGCKNASCPDPGQLLFPVGVLVLVLLMTPLLGQTGSVLRAYIFFPLILTMVFPAVVSRPSANPESSPSFGRRSILALARHLQVLIPTSFSIFTLIVITTGPILNSPGEVAFLRNQVSFQDYYSNSIRSVPPISRDVLVSTIGQDKRIWSLTLTTIGFLNGPGIHIETFISSRLSVDWHHIVFSEPRIAKKALQKAGMDFFFVDVTEPMVGLLPFSPLFSPRTLRDQFSVVQRWGSVYLLTWNDSPLGSSPISTLLVEYWNEELSLSQFPRLHQVVNKVFSKTFPRMGELKRYQLPFVSTM